MRGSTTVDRDGVRYVIAWEIDDFAGYGPEDAEFKLLHAGEDVAGLLPDYPVWPPSWIVEAIRHDIDRGAEEAREYAAEAMAEARSREINGDIWGPL